MAIYSIKHCWNEVGGAMRTSRLTSLPHLPDTESPKCGQKGAKGGPNKVKIAIWPYKLPHRSKLELEGAQQTENPTGGIWANHVRLFSVKSCEKIGPGSQKFARKGQSRPKNGF